MRRGRGVQPSGPLGGDGARPRRPAVGSMRWRCGATVGATVDSMDGWAPRGGAKVGAALEARWSAPSTDARDLHQYEHPQVQQVRIIPLPIIFCSDGYYYLSIAWL
jgi:hypothetical protein